jgi:hypothetical protein
MGNLPELTQVGQTLRSLRRDSRSIQRRQQDRDQDRDDPDNDQQFDKRESGSSPMRMQYGGGHGVNPKSKFVIAAVDPRGRLRRFHSAGTIMNRDLASALSVCDNYVQICDNAKALRPPRHVGPAEIHRFE